MSFSVIATLMFALGWSTNAAAQASGAARSESRELQDDAPSPGERSTPPAARDAALTPGAVRERARRDAEDLRAARQLLRAARYADALGAFIAVIERTPHAPRLSCEAGFVAQRAGDLESAERLLDQGLRLFGSAARVPSRFRAPMAMCLYNRGVVYEARSDWEHAVQAFQDSLALRPNRAVEGRLAAVQARLDGSSPVEDEDEDEQTLAWPRDVRARDLHALLRDLGPAVCEAARGTMHMLGVFEGPAPECETQVVGSAPAPAGGMIAHVLRFAPRSAESVGVSVFYLAIEMGGSVVAVAPVEIGDTAGWYPAHLELDALEWRARPGGPPVLSARLGSTANYYEDGCSEESFDPSLVACTVREGQASCALVDLGSRTQLECNDDQGGLDSRIEGRTAEVQFLDDGRIQLRSGRRSRAFTVEQLISACDIRASVAAYGCDALGEFLGGR